MIQLGEVWPDVQLNLIPHASVTWGCSTVTNGRAMFLNSNEETPAPSLSSERESTGETEITISQRGCGNVTRWIAG